jgi:hypothetical protein
MNGGFKVILALFTLLAAVGPVVGTAIAEEDTGKAVILETIAASNRAPWRGGAGNAIRFQCLWFQSSINQAGNINQIEFNYSSGTLPATFNNCHILLCHSTKTSLETTFANNYTGNTPVQVFNGTQTLSGSGWLDTHITPNLFNYNNTANLLMEITWDGDSGSDVYCSRGSGTARRCYNTTSATATTGTTYSESQYIRLHIATMTGVAPTSLGRVKALYQ